ncbi:MULTISPECIES: RNA methyltransferase [Pigmentiphaga]|jgi:tRNA/rRNA methyltransferase|uniref:tRNA (cytidine/uridine-2'-O-)-methyltransferase TrmJ n=1 Tax=Pigmentiphaga daeguensis TaxID=414049 RepID=A0ABP3LEL2_9BURK|nr:MULTISPECIES: RNA methyltransferase [unclassified Pigmentiphaga]OVZ62523.1 RNA methyltransferase [Pigmentiphaga sp. NML030171]
MLSRVSFVMVEPSHPGNVGSAARAIKTMGFARLVLVNPRIPDTPAHPEAIALASGATDVLAAARVCDTLEEALAPVTMAFAMTARHRDLGPPACDMRQAAELVREHLAGSADGQDGVQAAIVLGTERSGLTNEQVGMCHRICHIPANPEYSSLNVAQALQLAAYELRYALLGAEALAVAGPRAEPASGEAVEALLAHWEQALIAVGYLDPRHPKKLMPRMRHLFARSGLSREETDLLRGVCTAMIAQSRKIPHGSS